MCGHVYIDLKSVHVHDESSQKLTQTICSVESDPCLCHHGCPFAASRDELALSYYVNENDCSEVWTV